MPMNLPLTKPSELILALITMRSCGYGATPAFAQADAAHEKCLKATDYKGCIESQGLSIKDEQLITGIFVGHCRMEKRWTPEAINSGRFIKTGSYYLQ